MPRILIVEDDDHIRTALKLMFEGEGFDVDDAPTGELGVALFAHDLGRRDRRHHAAGHDRIPDMRGDPRDK